MSFEEKSVGLVIILLLCTRLYDRQIINELNIFFRRSEWAWEILHTTRFSLNDAILCSKDVKRKSAHVNKSLYSHICATNTQ